MKKLIDCTNPASIKGHQKTHQDAISQHLTEKGSCPCWSFQCSGVFIRCPEKIITILRRSAWPIDTWRKPDGDGSIFYLNHDPAELLDNGWTPLFMGLHKSAVSMADWSRGEILKAFHSRMAGK